LPLAFYLVNLLTCEAFCLLASAFIIILSIMADEKDSLLDKAESLARRMFERLGAKLDNKLGAPEQESLSFKEVDDLIAKTERAIDANLKADGKGTKRVAPHFFKVMFTYERALNLSRKNIEILHSELKSAIFEYLTNRRYEVPGEIQISIVRDFFEKSTTVKTAFEAKDIAVNSTDILWPRASEETQKDEVKKIPGVCAIHLRGGEGEQYRFELKAGGQPVCIGRAAGNRLRIEDASISRVHCSFALRSDGQIVLADLNSSNGTSVNDQPLHPNEARAIQQGDAITVGDIHLTVVEIV
jgi:hypothetical protein